MKTLLSTESPTYKRRLVREINRTFLSGSVYMLAHPYNLALRGVTYGRHTNKIIGKAIDGRFVTDSQTFVDGSGREIVASRE